MAGYEWLRYANRGATRNLDLSPDLVKALSFLPELGLDVEVFSGGQPAKGSGAPRVGSTRHDHGNAADVFFTKGGRRLDWGNPEDLPLFTQIVQRGKAAGITGFGAGPGYMQQGSMHIGFGSPGVWGAGGKGASAPAWLREAYGGAPNATSAIASAMGGGAAPSNVNAYAQEASMAGPKQSTAVGGLGGLGGFVPPERDDGFDTGGLLRALGAALIAGDASVIPGLIQDSQNQRDRAYERQYDRARDDWAFGVQRQDRMDERQERREDRQDNLDWRRSQHEYQIGQDRLANDRADRTLSLQEAAANRKEVGFRDATPEEAQARGVPAGQFGPDNRFYPIEPARGTTVNVNNAVPGDNKLLEKLSENEGKRWSDLQAAGTSAAGLNQDLSVLDELIKVAPQGPVTGRLAELFPEATDAGAAFQSVISRAAPGLRVEGSGATSDIEYEGMLRSLPRLRNSPEANKLIVDTMKAKADINVRRAQIVNDFQNGQLNASEARSRLNQLNSQSILSPGLKAVIGQTGSAEPAMPPASAPQPGTVEDGYRFKGGNPSDPASWELVS